MRSAVLIFFITSLSGITFERTYGGKDADVGYCVHQTQDGGYILFGHTWSYGAGYSDFYLIRTDSLGDTLWTKTYGGSYFDDGYWVVQTSDNGYALIGGTSSWGNGEFDVSLIKTDSAGGIQWGYTYGGEDSEIGYSIHQTATGRYIVAGRTNSYGSGNSDVYIIYINVHGSLLWSRVYGGMDEDVGYSVQSAGYGYIIAGYTSSFGAGDYDVYLIKIRPDGNLQWQRTYGGIGKDIGYQVQPTGDGGFIVVGTTNSFGAGGYDVYLIKTDSLGYPLWTRTYGGSGDEVGRSVFPIKEGGYIITGYTTSWGSGNVDLYLIKIDTTGEVIWSRTYGGEDYDCGLDGKPTSDGGYVAIGRSRSTGAGFDDVYLIKTDSLGNIEIAEEERSSLNWVKICPNPSYGQVNLDLPSDVSAVTLFDASGRLVHRLSPSPHLQLILPPGIYFLQIKTQAQTQTEKLIILR